MNKLLKKKTFVILLGLVLSPSFAQYEIKKHTINSGGANSSGGNYQLSGSSGQVDASRQQTGGIFSLSGGFWHQNSDLIFRNDFE